MPALAEKVVEPAREGDVVHAIRVALNERADCRVWRNNTGQIVVRAAELVRAGVPAGVAGIVEGVLRRRFGALRFGLAVGSADLVGIGPGGRFLAIEVKRDARARVTDEQRDWLAVVRRFGGLAGVARSVEEAVAIVEGRS